MSSSLIAYPTRLTLNNAQTMALRVALVSFLISLQEGLGDDKVGITLTAAYKSRINEILAMFEDEICSQEELQK